MALNGTNKAGSKLSLHPFFYIKVCTPFLKKVCTQKLKRYAHKSKEFKLFCSTQRVVNVSKCQHNFVVLVEKTSYFFKVNVGKSRKEL